MDWWSNRTESENAWKVRVEDVIKSNYNLEFKNPNKSEVTENKSPEEIVEIISEKERRIVGIMGEMKVLLDEGWNHAGQMDSDKAQ